MDDDPVICDSLALLLRSVGRHAETFTSAAEFLEVYDADRPGCLVLDLRMQGMNGLELQQRLECLQSPLPIVFLTGHGKSPMAAEAKKKGLYFVTKPFLDRDLIEKIDHAIAEDARRRKHRADGCGFTAPPG